MGFFFSEVSAKEPKKFFDLAKTYGCLVCPLNVQGKASPNTKFSGSTSPIIYVLGESPQDFVGPSGELLKNVLSKFISLDKVRFFSLCSCNVFEKSPEDFEIECCRDFVKKDLETTKPKVIIGLGSSVLKWAVKQNCNMLQWRGRKLPITTDAQTFWFYPVFHPSVVLKRRSFSQYKNEYEGMFELDIKNIAHSVEFLGTPIIESPSCYFDGVSLITKKEELFKLREALIYFKEQDKIAVDLETTGLSPYYGNKILSIAISNGIHTVAFPITYDKFWGLHNLKKELESFLLNSGLKICHNLKFDLGWLQYLFGKNIVYKTQWADTMSQAYVLDERTSMLEGMFNLDVLCRINLGFWLKDISNLDASKLNTYPLEIILKYNALDAKYTYRLYESQEKNLKKKENKSLWWADKHLNEVAKTLLLTQAKGVYVSQIFVLEYIKSLNEKLEIVKNELNSCKEIIEYNRRYKTFNPCSPKQVATLFKEILHLELDKKINDDDVYEEDGLDEKITTDKNTLLKYAQQGLRFIPFLIEYREITKLLGTYLERFNLKNEKCYINKDGVLRPQFTHCFTSTGRLSGQAPNLQNVPKRKGKYIRNIIVAPENYKFVAMDLGQIEARCIAFSSNDEVFCKAIRENYDIHKERALRICELYPEAAGVTNVKEFLEEPKKLKVFRDVVKNKFTFPLFYGAGYKSIAKNLKIPEDISKKICNETFEKFSGVKKWQKELLTFYNKYGYIESLVGRRRHGPLRMNAILNSPIQSVAADIMLVTMNNLSNLSFTLNKDYLQPVLSIHDDLSFYLPDAVLEEEIQFIAKEFCRINFSFINVPLSVEVSVGQSWGELEEVCTFTTDDFNYTELE